MKSQSGIFIKGKICHSPFQFKTNRLEIKNFYDSISEIELALPSRYQKKYDPNPIKTLEASVSELAASDEAVKLCSKWFESDIKLNEKPLLRVIDRHERRLAGKPRALTSVERAKLVEYVNQLCRKKVINSWRHGAL